ncbi:MAG: hypothetical protein JXO49_06990 [Deltaproteobacteria bacterium]|nr:hypothetical protein [Candidatus Anaeroferrophillus wilburensis]MBN2889073.1 hypothetical protein [Deltaproteobacteria bacterium]
MADQQGKKGQRLEDENLLPDQVDDEQWMPSLLAEVDEELGQVTEQLQESYAKLAAALDQLEGEIAAALEDGDEMKYEAGQLKKHMVLARLREIEALKIF